MRLEHTATVLQDGRVLIVGGLGGTPGSPLVFLDTAELFVP